MLHSDAIQNASASVVAADALMLDALPVAPPVLAAVASTGHDLSFPWPNLLVAFGGALTLVWNAFLLWLAVGIAGWIVS
jgi:hypothetical protein